MTRGAAFGRSTSISRRVGVPPERVFAVLADAWLIPVWLVGAAHIRDVDANWPAAGSKLHHNVGAWPLSVSDSTEVVEVDPPHRLVLQARAWPIGEARVELAFGPDGEGTEIIMTEGASRGPVRVFDNPLQRWVLRHRNRESLDRLATLAEKRPMPGWTTQSGG
ncbi:MAG TPA: SRPBCC family protein [Jatrophihabitantaceae bacterium]|jgi:uncharacterized protein YndB with AHSA1/START domain|nr:SRPBCC family protein [Jatrophihabitantaceae bacterium]